VIQFSSLLVERVDQQALQQRSKAIEDARKARQRLFIIVPIAALLTLLAATALGWYVTRTVTGPLSVVTACAEALARGDFQHQFHLHGDNELAVLGNAFNYAAQQLQKLYEDLRRSERELRDVINMVPAHAWSALPDGDVDFVNQCWQQSTGLPAEDALRWN
jgi:nitrogen fixation/metabolism regulation signal transduction histidine kinase